MFGFGKEIIRITVQHHSADRSNREHFFRNEFGGIENVIRKLISKFLIECLDAKLPFGPVPAINGLPEIAPMIIIVGSLKLESFVP